MSTNQKEDLLNFSFYAEYLTSKRASLDSGQNTEGLSLVPSQSDTSVAEKRQGVSTPEQPTSRYYGSDVDTSLVLKQIIENSPDLIFSVNLDYVLISANKSCLSAFKDVFGINLSVGQSILGQLNDFPGDRNELRKILSQAFESENLTVDMSLSKTNSIAPVYEAQFSKMLNASGIVIGVSCIFRDINKRALKMDQLNTLARVDSVTRTLKRRAFQQEVDNLIKVYRSTVYRSASRKRASIVYIGVDGLKAVRRECGYNAYERCLLKLSMGIRRELSKSMSVSRVTGGDFAVLVEGLTDEKVVELAERIQQSISWMPFKWRGRGYSLNCSIGITAVTAKTMDSLTALDQANLAYEVAQTSGLLLHVNEFA